MVEDTRRQIDWTSPDIVSPWSPQDQPITIREIEKRQFEEIRSYFACGLFEVQENFGYGSRTMDHREVYGRYMWHRKGELTDSERLIMIAHNRRLLEFLKGSDWPSDYPFLPDPEDID